MHELSLAENVVRIAAETAQREGARRVRTVILEIGQISHVAPEAMAFRFESVAAGTVVEGARLEIRTVAGEGKCRGCGALLPMEDFYGVCPHCGGIDLDPTAGTEMRVKAIEID